MSDKTRKYLLYAIGEIALVMIGILLALQVNNWNEDRKAANEEREYMEQLLDDARQDSVFFRSRKQILNQNFQWIRRARYIPETSWEDSVRLAIQDTTVLGFFFRTVHESFLINNNPDPFLYITDPVLSETLRKYQNDHNYVSQATDLLNRVVEEKGIDLVMTYNREIDMIYNRNQREFADLNFMKNEDVQATLTVYVGLINNAIMQLPAFLETNELLITQLQERLKK